MSNPAAVTSPASRPRPSPSPAADEREIAKPPKVETSTRLDRVTNRAVNRIARLRGVPKSMVWEMSIDQTFNEVCNDPERFLADLRSA